MIDTEQRGRASVPAAACLGGAPRNARLGREVGQGAELPPCPGGAGTAGGGPALEAA